MQTYFVLAHNLKNPNADVVYDSVKADSEIESIKWFLMRHKHVKGDNWILESFKQLENSLLGEIL